MEDAEVVLRRAPLFEGLDEEAHGRSGGRCQTSSCPEVSICSTRVTRADRLYVVLDGKLKLTRAAADGRENLLSVLGPGEMFGELSLFDPRPRTLGQRGHRREPRRSRPRCAAEVAGRPARRGHAPAARAGPAAPPRQRRGRPTWCSPTSQAGWRRSCSTWPTGSASRKRRPAGESRPDPGRARPAGGGVTGDGQQGPGRLRGARLAPDLRPVRPSWTPSASGSGPAGSRVAFRIVALALSSSGRAGGSRARPGTRAGRAPTTRRMATRAVHVDVDPGHDAGQRGLPGLERGGISASRSARCVM